MTRPPGKPDFLVLGAAKCGTTSLCAALARHPDVRLSDPKEPVFFEREYERGLDYYWEHYFSGWRGEPVVGEGRVYNLYLPFVPERIRESLPDARFVVVLRDPVERAHSHWWHRVTRGYERRRFEQAVRDELREIEAGRPFGPARDPAAWDRNFFPGTHGTHADVRQVPFLDMGHYAEQLGRYRALFPEDRFRILLFEELVEDGGAALEGLFRFLGVGPAEGEVSLPRRNVARAARKGRAAFLLERAAWALRLRRILPKRVRTVVRRALSRSARRPALLPETRERLLLHYRAPNRSLARLLGRRLPWDGPDERRSPAKEGVGSASGTSNEGVPLR